MSMVTASEALAWRPPETSSGSCQAMLTSLWQGSLKKLINLQMLVGLVIKIALKYRTSFYSFRENYSFFNLEIVANSNSSAIFQFLLDKLNFCSEIYSREETIQGRKYGI